MSSYNVSGDIGVCEELHYMEWKISNFYEILKAETFALKLFSPPFLLDNELFAIRLRQYSVLRNSIHIPTLDFSVCRLSDGNVIKNKVSEMGFLRNDGSKLHFDSLRGLKHIFVEKNEFMLNMRNDISNGDVTFFAEFCSEHKISTFGPLPTPKPSASEESYETVSNGCDFPENSGVDNLTESLKDMYLDGAGCDLFINVRDQQFKAHKCILSSRSKVFSAMLQHDMFEKNNSTLIVSDCDPQIFHEFLLYLYSGKVANFSDETVIGLFTVADKYDVGHLRSSCVNYMKNNLSISMFCDVIRLAENHNESELLKVSKEFFPKNSYKILRTPKWLSLMESNSILSNELLCLVVPRN